MISYNFFNFWTQETKKETGGFNPFGKNISQIGSFHQNFGVIFFF